MARPLAFVDDAARLPDVPPAAVVVALDPATEFAAQEAERDVLPIDAYLEDAEVEALGEQTFERVGEICDLVDQSLGIASDADPRVSSRWHFQELKVGFDRALVYALGATRLAEAAHTEGALVLAREDSLAAATLVCALDNHGVPTTNSLGPAHIVPLSPSSARLRFAGRAGRVRAFARRSLRPGRLRVLCLDESYSMPMIMSELQRRSIDVGLWAPPPPRPASPVALDLRRLEPLFRLANVDLVQPLRSLVRALVEHELPRDTAELEAARITLRRNRPDAILGSTFARPALKAAAVAARSVGVPSIAARHGELGSRRSPVAIYNDLDVVDCVLSWGEWEARFARRYAPRRVYTEVVGAPMIEADAAPRRREVRAALRVGADEIVALFVPTALSGDTWFIGGRAPTDLKHAAHQVHIVEQLLGVRGVRSIVQAHPAGPGLLEAWARRTDAPLTFIHGRRFAELVHAPDAVILDFPSTTLVQALQGSARVYVVAHPILEWEPGVIRHLERHDIRVVPPDAVRATVEADLASGWIGGEVSYGREAREPLLASGRGTAAERAADAVAAICSEHRAITIDLE